MFTILEKPGKSPLHCFLVDLMAEMLRRVLPPDRIVRAGAALHLYDSCPEPDLCVVPGPRDLYAVHHPRTALLVIEVAISSESLDREKAAIYAEAKVGEYWIVMPERRTVERFTHPHDGAYTRRETVASGKAVVSLTVPGFSVTLDGLLPKL
ncbi:MAG: Uma2 family endonuclease [Verrucomicrobiaceae bacterium]|nr:MAG: Uma2 family endonuclease [Verrucomicrobiaceae bacterium]